MPSLDNPTERCRQPVAEPPGDGVAAAPGPLYEAAKRVFDLIVCVPAAIVLGPVMLAAALVIKLDSPGPVFYRAPRIGLYGRPFVMMKFRTMVLDAEREGTTTALHDRRITRAGRVLRRYKLDELPQLFNVIRGDMSLVGPRPEVEEHTREYRGDERLILTVRPGVTDYASVRFFNLAKVLGSEDAHGVFLRSIRAQKNALRVEYVRRRSFVADLKILGLTAAALTRAVLRRGDMS